MCTHVKLSYFLIKRVICTLCNGLRAQNIQWYKKATSCRRILLLFYSKAENVFRTSLIRVGKRHNAIALLFKRTLENNNLFIGAALKCAPIMEWEFILASGRSSFLIWCTVVNFFVIFLWLKNANKWRLHGCWKCYL